jgi:hypothetical protein
MSSLLNDYTPTVYLTGTIKKNTLQIVDTLFLINNFFNFLWGGRGEYEAGKSKGLNRRVKISYRHLREEYLSFNNKYIIYK